MRRAVTALVLVAAILMAGAGPAMGCIRPPPPTLEDLRPGAPPFESFRWNVVGVFESETIERSTETGSGKWSVTVIVRYWGTPPPDVGPVTHGPYRGETSCGLPRLGAVGERHFGYVYERDNGLGDDGRAYGVFDDVGASLSDAQEVLLVDRFGSAQVPGQEADTGSHGSFRNVALVTGLLVLAIAGVYVLQRFRHSG